METDLRNAAPETFITFLFDKSVADESKKEEPWYWNSEPVFDPIHIIQLYIQLYTEPGFLLERYDRDKLEQGFWAIQSCTLSCSVSALVWDSNIDLDLREDCVRSIYFLFERLFSEDPLETSSYMWWDSLVYDYCCGNRSRERSEEDCRMQDVMFETLCRILCLEPQACQVAALHGLGHLRHPDTESAINSYITANPQLDDDTLGYALAAIKGEIL